ncbi:MAG TPA: DUF4149 domain-containing protein [Blastocatellia bacterium]|nr:DUF4149 domain-containing protein [Blastocatellia bacterium]
MQIPPRASDVPVAFAEFLLLSVWFGSILFFSFGVAPSAFAILPSHHLAGLMVTSALSKVEIMGLTIGPVLVILRIATWRSHSGGALWQNLNVVLLLVMTASSAVSRFVITPMMVTLRESMPDIIDQIPVTDPMRAEFDHLHHYSVALMSVTMFAGLLVIFLTVRSWVKR